MQVEEEAEQLVGGVEAEPNQRQEETVAVVVVVRVAGAGGALTRLALACGPAAALAPDLGVAEDSQEGIELVRCHAGKAPEGAGVAGQGLVDKHLATSTLPDKVGRSCQKAIAPQP